MCMQVWSGQYTIYTKYVEYYTYIRRHYIYILTSVLSVATVRVEGVVAHPDVAGAAVLVDEAVGAGPQEALVLVAVVVQVAHGLVGGGLYPWAARLLANCPVDAGGPRGLGRPPLGRPRRTGRRRDVENAAGRQTVAVVVGGGDVFVKVDPAPVVVELVVLAVVQVVLPNHCRTTTSVTERIGKGKESDKMQERERARKIEERQDGKRLKVNNKTIQKFHSHH